MDYAGSDRHHAYKAWASTSADFSIEMPEDINKRVDAMIDYIQHSGKKVKTVDQLIAWLMDPSHDPHTSPFRGSWFMFALITDVASHIHLLKHRVAINNINAESARYKELKEDKFYLPADWVNYGEEGKFWFQKLQMMTEIMNQAYHDCLADLVLAGMPKSRAKESARFFKTYNSQMNCVVTLSFDGLMQLYHKRKSGTGSQFEISQIVEEMVHQVKSIPGNPFAASLKAFGV